VIGGTTERALAHSRKKLPPHLRKAPFSPQGTGRRQKQDLTEVWSARHYFRSNCTTRGSIPLRTVRKAYPQVRFRTPLPIYPREARP